MNEALNIVVLGRAARNGANIKNRQPLGKMFVRADEALGGEYAEIIKDELNVKELEFVDGEADFVSYSFKPQLKTVGPKYGRFLGKIKEHLASLDGSAAKKELDENGALKFSVDGNEIELGVDDLLIDSVQKEGSFAVSDYGITEVFATPYTEKEIATIFKKARAGRQVTEEEALKFKSAWLYEGLKADAAANWTTQLHYNCIRDLNSAMYDVMGPDTGFDAIGDWSVGTNLAKLFDRLERTDSLPRCILYSLNPKDNEMLCSIMGSFQKAPYRGKIQLGSAWWFLDQKDGMRKQIETLSALGSLGNFIGMLTDSRSFLSYTRHEYFRRILCQKLGEEVEKGELPNDMKWLGGIVSDISFNNANEYFGFNA